MNTMSGLGCGTRFDGTTVSDLVVADHAIYDFLLCKK